MGPDNSRSFEFRILSSLRRIIRSVDMYSRKLNVEFGLTTPQLLCLDALARTGETTLSELAKEVNLGSSTVNGIIDRLEAKQYVERNRSTGDRRKVFIRLTGQGSELVERAPSLLQDRLSDSLARLQETEQLTITISLERIVELMEAQGVDASPNLIPEAQIGGAQ